MRLNILLLFLCFLLALTGPAFALSPAAIKTIAPLQTVTPSHLTVIPSVITTVTTTEPSFNDVIGTLIIESYPPGAEIEVYSNGERVNKIQTWITPYTRQLLTVYPYSIILKKPGYETYYSEQITLQPHQTSSMHAVLVPLTTTPAQPQTADSPAYDTPADPQSSTQQTLIPITLPVSNSPQQPAPGTGSRTQLSTIPGAGSLSITTNPAGAEIFIDGIPAGASPATIPGLSARPHNLTITMPGYADLITQVNVLDGQTVDYSTTLIPATEPTKPKAPGFEAAVAGIALAGVVLLKRLA